MSQEDSPAIDPNNSDENLIKFNTDFIINSTNQNSKTIDSDAKQNCKILKIPYGVSKIEQLEIISRPHNSGFFRSRPNQYFRNLISSILLYILSFIWNLFPLYMRRPWLKSSPSEYPNLFIFIIEEQNLNFLNVNRDKEAKQIVEVLNKFGAARPLIIQQICEAENVTKFYYKNENSHQIVDIDQHYPEDYGEYEKCQRTLMELGIRKLDPFEEEMLKKLSFIKNSSIIYRFLRTLNIKEAFFRSLALKVAKSGSKEDLLAVLDASFEYNGRLLNNLAENCIEQLIGDGDESESKSSDASNKDKMKEESDLEESSDEDEIGVPIDAASSQSKKIDSNQSVLLTAVQKSNREIIDYIMTYWIPLIQQLPVDHQIRISTAAFDTSQFDLLCDLLDKADFPFPENFTIAKSKINKNLNQITEERIKFHEVIEQENYKDNKVFIDKHLRLKFIYSLQNVTAMKKAINSEKYKVYFYLKSCGLRAKEFKNLEEVLDETELTKANNQAIKQRSDTTNDAIADKNKSVLILCTRAFIHNSKVNIKDETKYRKHIKKWFEDINKIAAIMIDVAASCENLVIIFDFENKFVRKF